MCCAQSVRPQPNCDNYWSALHGTLSGITVGWDNFLGSNYFISSRFGFISYRSHSWMMLIGSDQLEEFAYVKFSI